MRISDSPLLAAERHQEAVIRDESLAQVALRALKIRGGHGVGGDLTRAVVFKSWGELAIAIVEWLECVCNDGERKEMDSVVYFMQNWNDESLPDSEMVVVTLPLDPPGGAG